MSIFNQSLIMMLFNTATSQWHPIFYFEAPFPGGPDNNTTVIRYRSKGHHTIGFSERGEALEEVGRMDVKLKEMGYCVNIETDVDLPWDGVNIPTDHQLRSIPDTTTTLQN